MYNVIKDYCENRSETGLFLLDMPTGSGKTYSVLEYIFNACQNKENKNKKFFFITPLKKNLPLKDLKKIFDEKGQSGEFDKKVLFINSVSETVIENYSDKIERTIPDEIKNTQEFRNFREELIFLKNNRGKRDMVTRRMMSGFEEKFREEIEPNFRKMLSNILKKYDSPDQRLSVIKTDNKWKWVGKLYPSVFAREKQIIFMSMDKFLLKNAAIIEPSYPFFDIIENSIIFIDEFDSVKEIILKNIIQNNLRDRIDSIELFRTIHSALKTKEFSSEVMEISEKQIEDIRKKAEEIYERYSLQFDHHTAKSIEEHDKNFLFQDYQFHSIFNGDNHYVTVETDKNSRVNIINFLQENPSSETQSIPTMLGDIRVFIDRFKKEVNDLSYSYMQRKNELSLNSKNEFTHEQAIRSVLSLFRIEEKEKNYLTEQILTHSRHFKRNKLSVSDFDRSVYEHGFRYYFFENDNSHDMQTKIMMSDFRDTPEKILVNICERAKVIGISATATIPTVIGNFDIDYLRLRLHDKFYQLPEGEYKRLEQDFISKQSGYEKINIYAKLIDSNNYSLKMWDSVFDDVELAEDIYNRMEQTTDELYVKKRYLRIAAAFKEFLQHDDIKSMLCLLTKHPVENDNALDKNLIEEIFRYIGDYSEKEKLPVAYLKSAEYDNEKNNILSRLANGEKIFVISTFQTVGAGQNLQYPVPEDLKDKLICSNQFPPSEEKDFDAIYIDKPTNLFVNPENNWQEDNFVKYLFQTEFLQESGELSIKEAMAHIRKAFRCYVHEKVPEDYAANVHNLKSILMYSTRTVIQAIGRICRTNQKNPNIYIFADARLSDYIDTSVKNNRILNYEFLELIKLIPYEKPTTHGNEILKNTALLNSNRISRKIYSMLQNKWTDTNILQWKKLREYVMTHPTASLTGEQDDIIIKNYYIPLPSKSNILYYSQDDDFRNIKISFTQDSNIHLVENEEKTRLNRLMKWDILKKYFCKNNYATEFVPNDYIMSPPLWNNIYKGALGEVVGKFWFEHIFNISLEEIDDNETFELFDFKIPEKDIYVDFKNWNETTDMDWNEMIDKIEKKAKKCGCENIIVANIITKNEYKIQNFVRNDVNLLIIPSLLRDNGEISIDQKAVTEIRRYLNEYTDKNE